MTTPYRTLIRLRRRAEELRKSAEEAEAQMTRYGSEEYNQIAKALFDAQLDLGDAIQKINRARSIERRARNPRRKED